MFLVVFLLINFSNFSFFMFHRRNHCLLMIVCVTSHWMCILHLSTGVESFVHPVKELPSNYAVSKCNMPQVRRHLLSDEVSTAFDDRTISIFFSLCSRNLIDQFIERGAVLLQARLNFLC